MGLIKKYLVFLFVFLLSGGCTPTYRILTTNYNHTPCPDHKYEIINIKTGKIDTIYDNTYYSPGIYIKVENKDSEFKIIKILE